MGNYLQPPDDDDYIEDIYDRADELGEIRRLEEAEKEEEDY